jgi:hypothetical protein
MLFQQPLRQVLRHRGLPENSDFHDPMFKEHWLVTARSSAHAVGSRGRVCLHARLLIDEFSKCSDGAKNLYGMTGCVFSVTFFNRSQRLYD